VFNPQQVAKSRFHEYLKRPIRIDRPMPDVSTRAPTRCSCGMVKGVALGFLGGTCGP
jgi:hypothetical protein